MTRSQTRIVILGAGFGGLSVARLLSRSRVHRRLAITLVDKETESVYTPWLDEVAAGTVSARDAEIPLESVRGVRFRRATVQGIDRVARHVLCEDGTTIPFDLLVCALGSVSNDFDIPGVKAFALDLRRMANAQAIQEQIDRAAKGATSNARARIFVIGTGASGVELAAECVSRFQKHRGRSSVEVHLVGATSEILSGLPKILRRRAEQRLGKFGVITHLSLALTEVKERALTLQPMRDGIPHGSAQHEAFDVCMVALGVKVPDVVRGLGFVTNERGRVLVNDALQVQGESAIFGLGDSVVRAVGDADPQTAYAAMRQARHVARNIVRLIQHRSLLPYHSSRRWPVIVTLGQRYGVASLWGIPVWGYTVLILRHIVDAHYFMLATSFWAMLPRMIRSLFYAKGAHAKTQNMDRKRRSR